MFTSVGRCSLFFWTTLIVNFFEKICFFSVGRVDRVDTGGHGWTRFGKKRSSRQILLKGTLIHTYFYLLPLFSSPSREWTPGHTGHTVRPHWPRWPATTATPATPATPLFTLAKIEKRKEI